MGYNEKWIIELDRPKLEGFHEVEEHLKKAQEALYGKTDPEDVLRDLRAARDSLRDFYDKRKEEIFKYIDSGSSGEPGKPKKSERFQHIWDGISEFLNLGPHSDKYTVTYADAQLAFRQFVSVPRHFSA